MVNGKNLEIAIERLNLTQINAAEMIGISRSTLINWMAKTEFKEKDIKLINSKLNIDLHDFHDDKDTELSTELIIQLKERLTEKDERLKEKDKRIQDKEDIISLLKQQIESKK